MDSLKSFEAYLDRCRKSKNTASSYLTTAEEFLSSTHNSLNTQAIDTYEQQLNKRKLVYKDQPERELSLSSKKIRFSALHKYFDFMNRSDLSAYMLLKRDALVGDETFSVYDLDDKKITLLRETINRDTSKETYTDRLILELLDSTAARVSEIISLKMSDFDFERRMIKIYQKKQHRSREVRLTHQTENALKEYILAYQIKDNLFDSLTRQDVFYILERRCKEADIKFYSPHKFRHHRLTEWAKLVSLQELQAISGHVSLDALKRYLHIKAEDVFKKIEKAETAIALEVAIA